MAGRLANIIKITLLADNREANKKVGETADKVSKAGKKMGTAAKANLLVSGAATVAAVKFGKDSLHAYEGTVGAAKKLSRVTGASVEDASRLNEAAKQSGISADDFAANMIKLAKNQAAAEKTAAAQKLKLDGLNSTLEAAKSGHDTKAIAKYTAAQEKLSKKAADVAESIKEETAELAKAKQDKNAKAVESHTKKLAKLNDTAAETAAALKENAAALQAAKVGHDDKAIGRYTEKMKNLQATQQLSETGFAKLGISVTGSDGKLKDSHALLLEVAAAFKKLPNGPEKTALALKLFGKQGAAMIPLLNKGAEGIKELEKESDKLGTTISAKDAAATAENIKAKREWNAAIEGLKISVGRGLFPALLKFSKTLQENIPRIVKITKFMGDHGTALFAAVIGYVALSGALAVYTKLEKAFLIVGKAVVGVFRLLRSEQLKSIALWVRSRIAKLADLTVTIAVKTAQFAAAAASKAWAIAQTALNVAMSLNPIGLVIIAIVALVAVIIIAYKKSATFRKIVQGTFNALKTGVIAAINFVKKNWPIILGVLTGPIGLAIVLFLKHKKKILGIFSDIFHSVVQAAKVAGLHILEFLLKPLILAQDALKHVPGGAKLVGGTFDAKAFLARAQASVNGGTKTNTAASSAVTINNHFVAPLSARQQRQQAQRALALNGRL